MLFTRQHLIRKSLLTIFLLHLVPTYPLLSPTNLLLQCCRNIKFLFGLVVQLPHSPLNSKNVVISANANEYLVPMDLETLLPLIPLNLVGDLFDANLIMIEHIREKTYITFYYEGSADLFMCKLLISYFIPFEA